MRIRKIVYGTLGILLVLSAIYCPPILAGTFPDNSAHTSTLKSQAENHPKASLRSISMEHEAWINHVSGSRSDKKDKKSGGKKKIVIYSPVMD
ncbi:hypothetical protein EWH99_05110 [Sporolactobacillus sp. THM7-7]|nr:hypothetical protein EWH99_05110 [Sporolactobacillus sp. THM7-7]